LDRVCLKSMVGLRPKPPLGDKCQGAWRKGGDREDRGAGEGHLAKGEGL
jgi:hypothetical protein